MGIKFSDIVNQISKNAEKLKRDPSLPDDQTTDGHLKSLRRQSRVQDEKLEKKRLMDKIRKFNNGENSKLLISKGILSAKNTSIPKTRRVQRSMLARGKLR